MRYPRKINLYIAIWVILAAVLLSYTIILFKEKPFPIKDVLFFCILATVSEAMPVQLPRGGNITVTFAVDFAALLLFGPLAFSIIGGISYPLSNLIRGGVDLPKYLFNTAQTMVSAILAGLVFTWAGGTIGVGFSSQLVPVLLAGVVYFLINTVAVNYIISVQEDSDFWGIWVTNMKSVLPNLLTLAPMGFLLGSIYNYLGWLAICIYIAPLWLARHSFKQFTDMREMFLNTMKALSLAIDAKDNYTSGHSARVAEFAVAIAKQLKLTDGVVENLRYVALLHDIGKISVPENVLNKPGRLTEEEYTRVKEHSVVGANIVKEVENLGNAYHAIRHHHERYDGNGYPDGLRGEEIPLEARIIAVADTFDAMTSDRVYRKGLSCEVALQELRQVSGSQLDPRAVRAFLVAYSTKSGLAIGERLTVETEI